MTQVDQSPSTASSTASPPKPWLAGLLSLLVPGLGFAYLRRYRFAVLIYLGSIFPLFILTVLLVVDAAVVWGTFIASGLGLAYLLWQIAAVVRAARASDARATNSRGAFLLYAAIVVVNLTANPSGLYRKLVLESFSIPGASGVPALAPGDLVYVAKFGQRNATPQRGDLIVFSHPKPPHQDFIKRVVGLPGEEISIIDRVIHINGKPIETRKSEATRYWDRDSAGNWFEAEATSYFERLGGREIEVIHDVWEGTRNSEAVKIPAGHYFVLGDNRDNSFDSRMWGTVPAENVVGRAHSIWYSSGPEGMRFERIGQEL